MRRFLRDLTLLLLANLAAFALFLAADAWYAQRHVRHTWETEVSLMVMPRDGSLRAVFLGSSHARVFSGARDVHDAVEEALGGKVMNLAVSGGGVVPARVYLELFYGRGNRADTVVYFIDPWNLFRPEWNEENPFHVPEPFSPDLVAGLWRNGVGVAGLLDFFKAKLDPVRLIAEPFRKSYDKLLSESLDGVDPEEARIRLAGLYGYQGRDPAGLERYVARFGQGEAYARRAAQLAAVADTALAHGSRVLFVLPPTLFPEEPGVDLLLGTLQDLSRNRDVRVLDCTACLRDPRLYYHVDHLNRAGVRLFAGMLAQALKNPAHAPPGGETKAP